MTGKQLKAARLALGKTQMGMCRLLGISRATLARWEAGEKPIPHAVALLVPRLVGEAKASKRRGK